MSASPDTATRAGAGRRFWNWLPARVDGRVRVFAWLSFLAEVIIIGTGGAVRLTGSGLGCPTWPMCTAESLVPTPEMGIHGLIEFGNRTMTSVVGILAVIVVVLVLKLRRERRDLFVLALIVLAGVVAQAIVGGITVLTGLNPFVVGFHYVASVVLVCVTAAFLVRMDAAPGPRVLAVPRWFAILTHVTTLVLAVVVFVGVLTTASGPHSGDINVIRNGFDAEFLSHVHAWPGYVLLALVLVLTVSAAVLRLPPRAWLFVLLALLVVQIAVGIWQARNGLPEFLVGTHMVLASLSAAAMTVVVLRLKAPEAAERTASTSDLGAESAERH